MEPMKEEIHSENVSRSIEMPNSRPLYFLIIFISLIFLSIFLIGFNFGGPLVVFSEIIGYLFSGMFILYLLKQEESKQVIQAILIFVGFSIGLGCIVLIYQNMPVEIFLGYAGASFLLFLKAAPYSIQFTVVEFEDYYLLSKNTDYLFFKTEISWNVGYDVTVELRVTPRGIAAGTSGYYNYLVLKELGNKPIRIEFSPIDVRGLDILDLVARLLPYGTRIQADYLDRTTGGIFSTLEPKVRYIDTEFSEEDTSSIVEQFKQLNELHGEQILVPSRKSLFTQMLFGLFFILFFLPIGIIFSLVAILAVENHNLMSSFFSILFVSVSFPMVFRTLYKYIINPTSLLLGNPKFDERDGFLLYYCKLGPFKSHTYKIPVSLRPKLVFDSHSYSVVCRSYSDEYYKLPLIKTEMPLLL